MNDFTFDFTRSATRASIVGQLLSEIEKREIGLDFDQIVDDAGIPDRHHHDLAEVNATVDVLEGVNDDVKKDMRSIYQILTEAEAQVHGTTVDHAHFHEVGRAEGIRNVLLVCLMMNALKPEKILASRIQTGFGKVHCDHGVMDIPAPATTVILGKGIPVCEELLEGELCTPTSAAMIFHFVDEYIW